MVLNKIELNNLSVYRDNKLVLSKINIKLERGEFVYLTGKVGTGKTSLIKTLTAEIPLSRGEANILGYNLRTITRKEIPYLRRKIGVVFQDFQLLTDRSVYDNLKFVLEATGWKQKEDINNRIKEVLTKVGLLNKIYKMPNQLSGGEQQRIVIARALLNDPEIVMADEPTGNLDPETSSQIMDILWSVQQNGRTVMMATHDYSMVLKYPGRILKLENGMIKEASKEDLIAQS
jgi:cell division transport system ATP-binding protein